MGFWCIFFLEGGRCFRFVARFYCFFLFVFFFMFSFVFVLFRFFLFLRGMGGTQVRASCNLTRAAYEADCTVQHHIWCYGQEASKLSHSDARQSGFQGSAFKGCFWPPGQPAVQHRRSVLRG